VNHRGDIRGMATPEVGYFTAAWVVGGSAILMIGEALGRRRQLRIRMSADKIEINGRSYERAQGYNQFAVEEHEKRFREARAINRGQGGRLYLDAVQVVMRYRERRVPIADFRDSDADKADALFLRLQWLNENFDKQMALHGQGQPSPAADDDDFGPARPIR
jgi:hypothetical protein